MGQGQDKIAISLLELQPTAIVELFILYFNPKDDPDSFFAFHGGSILQKPIKWQGIEYLPLPVETEGFEVNANGRIARPKIKVSNKDYIISDFLRSFNDLQFAKLIRKRTFVKFLDNSNFINGNPWGQQDSTAELSNDTFIMSQKTAENKLFVEFELTSPLDIDGMDINNRKILSTYCGFTYRGEGCYYNGLPLTNDKDETLYPNNRSIGAFKNGNPSETLEWVNNFIYKAGDIVMIENKNAPLNYYQGDVVEQDDPTFLNESLNFLKNFYVAKSDHISSINNSPTSANRDVFWYKDECVKTINACKKRFNSDSFTKYYTGKYTEDDNFIDFTSKIPTTIGENTGIYLELAPTQKLNSFFNTGFYENTFTIAMWISVPKKPARVNYPYSVFTNANHLTQNNTEGTHALNYYLWNTNTNLSLNQHVKIKKSDGSLKINTNDPNKGTNFWIYGGDVIPNNSYQFLLFECSNPKSAGGYLQLSINNNTSTERLTLGIGEQFTFPLPEYNSYKTGHFKINANNMWGSWYNQSPRLTPVNIHSVIIWSRLLSNAEKLWLGRANIEPNTTREIQEVKMPRKIREIPTNFSSLTGNNLQFWWQDECSPYYQHKVQDFYASVIKPGQGSTDVKMTITGLNYDLKNTRSNTFEYEYSYTKTPNYWLPFGGFPGTYKFAYGET